MARYDYHIETARRVAIEKTFKDAESLCVTVDANVYSYATVVADGDSYDVDFYGHPEFGVVTGDIVLSAYNL